MVKSSPKTSINGKLTYTPTSSLLLLQIKSLQKIYSRAKRTVASRAPPTPPPNYGGSGLSIKAPGGRSGGGGLSPMSSSVSSRYGDAAYLPPFAPKTSKNSTVFIPYAESDEEEEVEVKKPNKKKKVPKEKEKVATQIGGSSLFTSSTLPDAPEGERVGCVSSRTIVGVFRGIGLLIDATSPNSSAEAEAEASNLPSLSAIVLATAEKKKSKAKKDKNGSVNGNDKIETKKRSHAEMANPNHNHNPNPNISSSSPCNQLILNSLRPYLTAAHLPLLTTSLIRTPPAISQLAKKIAEWLVQSYPDLFFTIEKATKAQEGVRIRLSDAMPLNKARANWLIFHACAIVGRGIKESERRLQKEESFEASKLAKARAIQEAEAALQQQKLLAEQQRQTQLLLHQQHQAHFQMQQQIYLQQQAINNNNINSNINMPPVVVVAPTPPPPPPPPAPLPPPTPAPPLTPSHSIPFTTALLDIAILILNKKYKLSKEVDQLLPQVPSLCERLSKALREREEIKVKEYVLLRDLLENSGASVSDSNSNGNSNSNKSSSSSTSPLIPIEVPDKFHELFWAAIKSTNVGLARVGEVCEEVGVFDSPFPVELEGGYFQDAGKPDDVAFHQNLTAGEWLERAKMNLNLNRARDKVLKANEEEHHFYGSADLPMSPAAGGGARKGRKLVQYSPLASDRVDDQSSTFELSNSADAPHNCPPLVCEGTNPYGVFQLSGGGIAPTIPSTRHNDHTGPILWKDIVEEFSVGDDLLDDGGAIEPIQIMAPGIRVLSEAENCNLDIYEDGEAEDDSDAAFLAAHDEVLGGMKEKIDSLLEKKNKLK